MLILTFLLAAFGTYLTVYVLYQLLLFITNAVVADPVEFEPARIRRFNVLLPAHNEELYLPRLLESLQLQDYPKTHFRVTVVADNCTDRTAESARRFDVDVLERKDPNCCGKGYAIKWTVERIDIGSFDGIVIVDGDSIVSPGFLKHLNVQMERGDSVIQCYNGVANPGQSWLTRLMNVSRTIANEILHPAKRKLGLSSHLMGNGMCFDVRIFDSLGWSAFSVGEDWEYYARLVQSGAHVGYSRLARVYHQESIDLRQASSQRLRWSSGRFQVLCEYGTKLFLNGLRTGDVRCLDASLPLVFPNPSLGMNLTAVGLALALLVWLLHGGAAFVLWFGALTVSQVAMFMIGVLYTQQKASSAMSLVVAPVFLAWKMGIDILSLCGVGRKEWTRTHRKLS